jgi:hypothetical protein
MQIIRSRILVEADRCSTRQGFNAQNGTIRIYDTALRCSEATCDCVVLTVNGVQHPRYETSSRRAGAPAEQPARNVMVVDRQASTSGFREILF